jgi:hemolysin III
MGCFAGEAKRVTRIDATVIPRLRGVFHLWAFFAALAAGGVLVLLADGVRERLAAWVYAAALAAMFGASALYHRFPWRSAAARLRARRLDHATIFVCIAGTYTPFALLGFDGTLQVGLLVAVWSGAVFGLVVKVAWIAAPKWLSTVAYLSVGWVGVIAVPELFGLGIAAAVLAVCGAGLYTLGALTYATGWPNPLPATLGFHEIFHLLVVAAAVAQFVAVALVVI